MKDYSTLEIGKALDIPRERLRDWMDRGFIKPTIAAKGQGTKAVFTKSDVYCVALFMELLESGFSREVAASWISLLDKPRKPQKADAGVVNYILFREGPRGSQEKPTLVTLEGIEWDLSLKTGVLGGSEKKQLINRDPFFQEWAKQGWRKIFIVNFRQIRNEVDAALARL